MKGQNTLQIDVASLQKCYGALWSYGEICVYCDCCNKNTKIRRKARLKYWKWWLKQNLEFDLWAIESPTLLALQKKNVHRNIQEAQKKIRYYLDKKK